MRDLLLLAAFLVCSASALPAQPAMAAQVNADVLFHQLLDAQVAKDYDAFVAHGTVELKAALTKTQFEASSDLMIARTKGGFEIAPLGKLNKKGYQVYLYRLRFKDGGDDMLGTMSLKNEQVAGIYFK